MISSSQTFVKVMIRTEVSSKSDNLQKPTDVKLKAGRQAETVAF